MVACVLLVRWADTVTTPTTVLLEVAQRFSPRVAWVESHALAIDLHGLERLFGEPRAIGEQLRRALAQAGLETHVAVAPTRTARRSSGDQDTSGAQPDRCAASCCAADTRRRAVTRRTAGRSTARPTATWAASIGALLGVGLRSAVVRVASVGTVGSPRGTAP